MTIETVMKSLEKLEGTLAAMSAKADGELATVGKVSADTKTAMEALGVSAEDLHGVCTYLKMMGATTCDTKGGVWSGYYLDATLPGVAYHPLHIEPTVVQRALELQRTGRQLTAQDAVGLMQDTYRGFVHDNAPRFAELFRLLLTSDTPTVFHCTAGKDRTGFAAALILLTLGVPRDVVMHDYLLTNALYQRPPGMGSHAPEEVLRVLWRVQDEFLDAALHMVDNDFGGLQAYLVDVLGVDAAAQKELAGRYLQTA